MRPNNTFKEIAELAHQANSILVISHYNPDADAYGSSCALALALKSIGKNVFLLNETKSTDKYSFIPGTSQVKNELPEFAPDLIIACDCGSLERVGDSLIKYVGEFENKVNLDHHVSNSYFAKLNHVDFSASSTAEVVFNFIKELGISITADIACGLYSGISGDTGSFKYSSTTARTFEIATELVRAGAKPDSIAKELYSKNNFSTVMLHSYALSMMNLHFDGKVSEVIVDDEMLEKYNAGPEDTEALVEKARDITGVLVSVMIRQDENVWKVSMRSASDRYNVSDVAASFGGGGHKAAAAFRWRKDLDTLRSELLAKLSQIIK